MDEARARRRAADKRDFLWRLGQAQIDAGLTQREPAKKLGRSQSFVQKAESGERRLDAVELRECCRAYGKAPAYFFGSPWSEPIPAQTNEQAGATASGARRPPPVGSRHSGLRPRRDRPARSWYLSDAACEDREVASESCDVRGTIVYAIRCRKRFLGLTQVAQVH